MGDRLSYIKRAVQMIQSDIGCILKKSKIYETAAWGNTKQASFLNQILYLETEMSASEVLKKCLSIESKMGRVRVKRWSERSIDIDILFFNDETINEENLKIPHPFMQERRFVLVPLSEIAPNKVHPIFQKTISQLLENCSDNLLVTEYKFN